MRFEQPPSRAVGLASTAVPAQRNRMAAPLYTTDSGRLYHAGQILLASVGLPARGKTHVSRSVERYLRWLGVKTEVFSLGDHRRRYLGSRKVPDDYFKEPPRSAETEALRAEIKESLEDEVVRFFKENRGQVAVYDANNGTRELRKAIRSKFEALGINVFFIENICDDPEVIQRNIRSVKISSPDFQGWEPEDAVAAYMKRIKSHEDRYESIDSSSGPFCKVFNAGERLMMNNVRGYLQSRIVFFLMNIHNEYRTIWFARSGEAQVEHSFKADSDLTPTGERYAEKLRDFIIQKRRDVQAERLRAGEKPQTKKLRVWTSARKRCASTCKPFAVMGYKIVERQQMYELNPGVIDGLDQEEIVEKYPKEWQKAQQDPYSHRYPRAESYHDVSVRLEPVILELEREKEDVVLIGHASVIRCLLAYLQGLSAPQIPMLEVKRGEVIEVTPTAYGVNVTRHSFWTEKGEEEKRGIAASPAQSPAVRAVNTIKVNPDTIPEVVDDLEI